MLHRLKRRPPSHKVPLLEALEDRCLLSAVHHGMTGGHTILFSQAPAAVQTGLDALAAADSLAAPTDSQTVYLGNRNGVETYTLDIVANGVDTKLTVTALGKAYTAPTRATTTFGAITNTAVTDELNAIAAALNLTAPAATDSVIVTTASDGTQTFTYTFASPTSRHRKTATVDTSGNPVGSMTLPLSVFSSAISTALTNAAPVGATPLTSTSLVSVQTANGVTTYSATYYAPGIRTKVSVNSAGTLTSLPSLSAAQFSTIPLAAQNELQTLATANGYTGTISASQNVRVYDEANGTVIYTITVPVTASGTSGATYTYNLSVSADQAGNPTVPPSDGGFGGGCFGGEGSGGLAGPWGNVNAGGQIAKGASGPGGAYRRRGYRS